METKKENENFLPAQESGEDAVTPDYTVSSLREMWEVIQKLYPEKLGGNTKPRWQK